MTLGRLFGIGVGPGDPELLTVKAARILAEVPVVFAPRAGSDSDSFALSIARPYIDESRQRIYSPLLPMSMDKSVLDAAWSGAADAVAEELRKGNDCAFLTLGDPAVYSTYSYVSTKVRERMPEAVCETVSGISSIMLAAAKCGVDLALGQEKIAVLPLGRGTDIGAVRKAVESFDTVVLMKANSGFAEVRALLDEMGLSERAFYVNRVGTERERIIKGLSNVGDDLDYFSLILIKK
jgi:precorrin-2/cobalt-factor-2 C20-methyltransferase